MLTYTAIVLDIDTVIFTFRKYGIKEKHAARKASARRKTSDSESCAALEKNGFTAPLTKAE